MVKKASHDQYVFKSANVEFSFGEKQVSFLNSVLLCRDTSNTERYYNLRIQSLQLSIQSWRHLLLDRRLEVNSFVINHPVLSVTDKRQEASNHSASFHLNTIAQPLEQALKILSVKEFRITDGSIQVFTTKRLLDYRAEGINFHILNFLSRKTTDRRFLFSDDVDLMIRKQELKVSNGTMLIATGPLHFSGAKQFFQVDSVNVRSTPLHQHQFAVSANQVGFRSSDLTSSYEKEEITLDSMWVDRPTIVLEKGKHSTDSVQEVHNVAKALLASIKMSYVSISGGAFQLHPPGSMKPIYETGMIDVRVTDLQVDRSTRRVSARDIEVIQRNLVFTTPDSMYQLTVAEFSFRNNQLDLRNVHYKPTDQNHTNKALEFKAPVLKLTNVSIEDLVMKRLRASTADLHQPSILIASPGKKPGNNTTAATKSDLFFKTLASLHEMIHVDSFRLHNASLATRNSNNGQKLITMQSVDAIVLLNRFFESNSMFKIKRSLPELRIGTIRINAPNSSIMLQDYRLQGTLQHNHVAHLSMVQDNGSSVEGNDISWDHLDWDELQLSNHIHLQKLTLGELTIDTKSHRPAEQKTHQSPLPEIVIGDLEVSHLKLRKLIKSSPLQLIGKDVAVSQLRSMATHFEWNSISGSLLNISWSDSAMKMSVDAVHLGANGEHGATGIDISTAKGQFHIPEASLTASLRSSDFKEFKAEQIRFIKGSASWQFGETKVFVPEVNFSATQLLARPNAAGKLEITANIKAAVDHIQYARKLNDSTDLSVRDIRAEVNLPAFRSTGFVLSDLLNKSVASTGRVSLTRPNISVEAQSMNWNVHAGALQVTGFSVLPRSSMEETFRAAGKQVDYMQVNVSRITIHYPMIRKSASGIEKVSARKISIDTMVLSTTKDKRLPFESGHEKPMFTDMARKLRIPFLVDTISMQNSTVTIHEISPKTKRQGTVPLEDINVLILNFTNQPKDSLLIWANLKLYNNYVTAFQYQESYLDSLAGFRLAVKTSKMNLQEYSKITVPIASADILRGNTAGLQAAWTGNRKAAVGKMQFPYRHLKIRVLDEINPERKTLMLSLKSFLANSLLIKNSNNNEAIMFFVRNKDRSVFNYWVKTKLSGVMSSAVRTKNKSTTKKYLAAKDKYNISLNPQP